MRIDTHTVYCRVLVDSENKSTPLVFMSANAKKKKTICEGPKILTFILAVDAAGVALAVTVVAEPKKQNKNIKKRSVTTKK